MTSLDGPIIPAPPPIVDVDDVDTGLLDQIGYTLPIVGDKYDPSGLSDGDIAILRELGPGDFERVKQLQALRSIGVPDEAWQDSDRALMERYATEALPRAMEYAQAAADVKNEPWYVSPLQAFGILLSLSLGTVLIALLAKLLDLGQVFRDPGQGILDPCRSSPAPRAIAVVTTPMEVRVDTRTTTPVTGLARLLVDMVDHPIDGHSVANCNHVRFGSDLLVPHDTLLPSLRKRAGVGTLGSSYRDHFPYGGQR